MIIQSIRITLSAPYWLIPYGGNPPPVFKIRGKDFEFGLAELDSLRKTGGFTVLGHYCQIANLNVGAEHLDLVGQMRSGTQPYIDELLAAGWQMCDEKALVFYQMPQAADPSMPEQRQPWEPHVIGLPPIAWPPSPPSPAAASPAPPP